MAGAFIFDANRCTGCGACRVACTIENGLPPATSWRRIETFNVGRVAAAPVFHLSIACNHCGTAACMNACPALAYRRDGPTGAVLLDSSSCIGCGYCSWACPYDAPLFDESAGVMTKCNWCVDRLRAGLKPACVSHCPTGALDYSSTPIPARVSALEGLPATLLDPSLHVIPLEAGRTQPEMTAPIPADGDGLNCHPAPTGAEISLRHEWPLPVFTLGAALLVGGVTGAATGAYRLHAWVFAVAALFVMSVPHLHLGRIDRAWRAVLNVRRSWLSREVVFLSLFVTLATLWLFVAPDSPRLGLGVALVGFAGLFCADRLYGVLPGGGGYRHSAGVTYTAVLFAAVFAGSLRLAALALVLKLGLYGWRKWRATAAGLPSGVIIARVGSGMFGLLLLPALLPAAALLILVGEIIDRCEYYTGLSRQTPGREMARALARRLHLRLSASATLPGSAASG